MNTLFDIKNEFSADIMNFNQNSVFAFDLNERVFWISDSVTGSSVIKIPVDLNKDAFNVYKVAICRDLPIFAYVNIDETSAIVMNAQQSRVINSFKIQDSRIESLFINDSGDTLLIGGKNGILSRWDIYSGKLLDMPNKHKDSILFAKESSNKRFVISIGYDRSVFLFDSILFDSYSIPCNANSTIRDAIFFDDSRFIALCDISGYIYIVDSESKILINKFQATTGKIIDIAHYKSPYLFYLNANGVIGVVDFNAKERILDSFMPHKKYKSFTIANNNIILCGMDNIISSYSFCSFIDYGNELIYEKKFMEAYKFIENNQFLKSEDFYIKLESIFEADVLYALALAYSNKISEGINILNKYLQVPSKNKYLSSLLSSLNSIKQFQEFMSNNMQARAIPMVTKDRILCELKSYISFENKFKRDLIIAKELVKKGRKSDANTLMMEYKKIPSKIRPIQEVLSSPQDVDYVINIIKQRDYKTFFELRKRFRFIDYLDQSKLIEYDGEKYYYELLDSFYSMNLDYCKECLDILRYFPQYKDFIVDIEPKINEIISLL